MEQQQHLFTNKMLRALLVPIIMEQLLNALMGTVDTMMVSNVGSAAISAVSLVDSINVLIIQAFSALAAGGTIICTQYLGQKNHEMAICQTGSFYHNCHFRLHCHIGTDFPCTTAELYFRKSRCGCYG